MMCVAHRHRVLPLALWLLAAPGPLACGLTVTNEPPSYEELDPSEKKAVDIIYEECLAFNNQIYKKRPTRRWGIAPIVNKDSDKNHINTSFEGMVFIYNFGDGKIHIAAWENLTDTQRTLIQGWFKRSTLQEAKVWYEWFFYRFMAVAQCAKQYMFNEHGPQWVFSNRYIYTIERDAIRTALAYFKEVGRQTEVWSRTASYCTPVLSQYASRWGHLFKPQYKTDHYKLAKQYMQDNFQSLANPDDPTGFMYWICQGIVYEKTPERLDPFSRELEWLEKLDEPESF